MHGEDSDFAEIRGVSVADAALELHDFQLPDEAHTDGQLVGGIAIGPLRAVGLQAIQAWHGLPGHADVLALWTRSLATARDLGEAMSAFWPEETTRPNPVAAQSKFILRPQQRNFWSFQPVRKPTTPAIQDAAWAKTPVDRFILAKIEEKGLKPVHSADKRTLIRRASYDLIGLPPTPEQVDAFLVDNSPEAYTKLVDQLLASPHYGERWARHWLDVARYADGSGVPDRRPVFLGYGTARDGYANTWRYQDWVIQAFNEDMPYDQFVRAQIAADLMPATDRSKLLPALGFFGIRDWSES